MASCGVLIRLRIEGSLDKLCRSMPILTRQFRQETVKMYGLGKLNHSSSHRRKSRTPVADLSPFAIPSHEYAHAMISSQPPEFRRMPDCWPFEGSRGDEPVSAGVVMKKTLMLCLLAGSAGALVTLLLVDPPELGNRSLAQDFFRYSENAQAAAPHRAGAASGSAWTGCAARRPFTEWGAARAAPGFALDDAAEPDELADLLPEERVNCQVYETVNRSVVNINTRGYRGDRFLLIEIPSEGAGSGVVLDRQGHVLTNYHVVDGAKEIQVALFNGKTYDAQLVGKDAATDVAVIRHRRAGRSRCIPSPWATRRGCTSGRRFSPSAIPLALSAP